MIYLFLLIPALLVGVYMLLLLKVTKHRPETYPNAENRAKIDRTKKIVVCFGDSNTHGNVSHNWVNDLTTQLPDYQFFNAGINSDLTYTLLRRMDDVIACQPDFVTILIGTNDVNSTMSLAFEHRYQNLGRVDKNTSPNFDTFCKNYEQIVHELKQKTQAKIALVSLPVMGEDLSHEANIKADKYSEFIKELTENQGITYLPFREMEKEFLVNHPHKLKHKFEETYKLLNISGILHYIFGWSFDKVSQLHGYQLTPDNLHLNSVSGGMITRLVRDFLEKNK